MSNGLLWKYFEFGSVESVLKVYVWIFFCVYVLREYFYLRHFSFNFKQSWFLVASFHKKVYEYICMFPVSDVKVINSNKL